MLDVAVDHARNRTVFSFTGTKEAIFTGGEILYERQGDGGFGYDPLFFVPECNCSSAELPPEEKNARSHRGQALRKLVELIAQHYA